MCTFLHSGIYYFTPIIYHITYIIYRLAYPTVHTRCYRISLVCNTYNKRPYDIQRTFLKGTIGCCGYFHRSFPFRPEYLIQQTLSALSHILLYFFLHIRPRVMLSNRLICLIHTTMSPEDWIVVFMQYFALHFLIYFLRVTHFPIKSTYSRQGVCVWILWSRFIYYLIVVFLELQSRPKLSRTRVLHTHNPG
jgi:hypothetical protein